MPTLPINWLLKNHISGAGESYGPELHTLSNAAADPNGTEADATTGFDQTGLDIGANVFASQSGIKSAGSFSIEASSDDTPTALARFYVNLSLAPFNFIDGDQSKLEFDIRHKGTGVGTGVWRCYMAATNSGTSHLIATIAKTDLTFLPVQVKFTYAITYRYLLFREYNTDNDGGIYFDDFSAKKK